eukprot:m.870569 g.870569  ORF g.870569 m.870569 type:complete len:653 (-) comp23567_c0_seq1:2018-3976(-)
MMSSSVVGALGGASTVSENKRFSGQADNANARKAKRRREVEERAERERLRVETNAPIQPPYVWGMRVPIKGDTSDEAKSFAAQQLRTIIATGAIICPPRKVSEVLKQLQAFQRDLGRDDDMEVGAVVRGKVVKYDAKVALASPSSDPHTKTYHSKLRDYVDRMCKASGTEPSGLPLCAVHVSPTVAVTVEQAVAGSNDTISAGPINERAVALLRPLCEQISARSVLWAPGLRVKSPGCIGKTGTKEHTYCSALATQARKRLPKRQEQPRFKFAELFAGIGGFRVALEQAGGECVFASEIDHEARCTYAMNFGDVASGDIAEIETGAIPSFDVLTAGFPCQSHSRAGYQRGFDDYRGCLFFEVTRLLHSHSPAVFILENVPNLTEINNGAALALILDELSRAGLHGYDVAHMAINNSFRVPQQRERLYFVGFSKSPAGRTAAAKFQWPEDKATPCVTTVRDVLESDASPDTIAAHTLSNHKWSKVQTAKKTGLNIRNRLCRLDGAARTLCSNYRRGYAQMSEFVPFRRSDGSFVDHVAAFNADLASRAWTNGESAAASPAHTVSTGTDGDGDDSGEEDETEKSSTVEASGTTEENPRFYTPRECARLMGFPEDFVIDEVCKSKNRIYHQMGNAVVPPVVASIMDKVVETGIFA